VRASGPSGGSTGAVSEEATGPWRLLFAGDDKVERDPRLREQVSTDGDGHATLASQEWLSAEETAHAQPTVYVPGAHFEMILTPEAAAAIADALYE
jgi:hypothetical protein